jgi:hypothetical protein
MFTRFTPLLLAAGVVLLAASPVRADGPARLVSPLLQALAIGSGMAHAQMRAQQDHLAIPTTPPPREHLSIIPPRVEIPDGYDIDMVADPPRFTEPVDRSQQVSFDLLGGSHSRATLSVSYDTEHKEIGDTSDLLRMVLKIRF